MPEWRKMKTVHRFLSLAILSAFLTAFAIGATVWLSTQVPSVGWIAGLVSLLALLIGLFLLFHFLSPVFIHVREEEARFRAVIESAPSGMIMVDKDGKIRLVNAQAEKLFGYTRDELMGQSIEILVPEAYRGRHAADRTGYHRKPEVRLMGRGRDLHGRRKDGRLIPVEIGLNPVRAGKDSFVLAVIADISERKRAEERTTILGRILDASANEIYILDAAGFHFLQANKAARDNLGYSASQLPAMTLRDLQPDLSTETLQQLLAPLSDGTREKVDFTTVFRRRDGSEYPVEVHMHLTTFEAQPAYAAIVMDISQRQEMERRIISNERLAAMGKMSSHVAHEVRNPLSSISLNLDLLHDEVRAVQDLISEERKRETESLLKSIQKEVDRLSHLVEDYLRFSRLPQFKKEKVELEKFLHECIGFIREEARKHQVRIDIETAAPLPEVWLDPAQMQQVMLNLLRNSIEAMPNGGRIGLHAAAGAEGVQIRIQDEGGGIDENTREKIFEPFFTTKAQGTGLGLAVARQIITGHEGTLKCCGQKGEGAVFLIGLPAAERRSHHGSR